MNTTEKETTESVMQTVHFINIVSQRQTQYEKAEDV